MDEKERARRARELLNDTFLNDVLAEIERRAVEDFVTAHRWWWGDRKRRIAAERLSVARSFRKYLDLVANLAPPPRINRA